MDSPGRRLDERGGALLVTLLISVLLGALAAAVLSVTATETLLTGNHRIAHEVTWAADAGLERAIHDLAAMPSWDPVLAVPPSNAVSTFTDGQTSARTPDGSVATFAALSAARQRDGDLTYGPALFGADAPQWRLFAHAPLRNLLPGGIVAPPAYLIVWVADDGGDGDGNPLQDANGRILVHAEAYGAAGAHRAVEAGIARAANGTVQMLTWREVR